MTLDDVFKNSVFAAPETSISRRAPENPPKNRSEFQRDRDRILYSKSFRRLSGKTQVFTSRSHDHIRTRLTHSLEVNQIAHTTAKILGLNLDLTEAIALGHDIGHTPFGHVGERTLNFLMNNCMENYCSDMCIPTEKRGFKHNLQSVRILDTLHSIYPHIHGTNMTNFTLYGIANHSSLTYPNCTHKQGDFCYRSTNSACEQTGELLVTFYDQYKDRLKLAGKDTFAWSFEAFLVSIADEIAQRHHDIEDALVMHILTPSDIVDKMIASFNFILNDDQKSELHGIGKQSDFALTLMSQFIVGLYSKHLIDQSCANFIDFTDKYGIKSHDDFIAIHEEIPESEAKDVIQYDASFKKAEDDFHNFLRKTILNSHKAQRMDGKGSYLIEKLIKVYATNPRQLHDSTILAVFNMLENKNMTINSILKTQLGEYRNKIADSSNRADAIFQEALLRAISDHIAGMTDHYVLEEYSRLYGGSAL